MNIPSFSVRNGVLLSIVMVTLVLLGGISVLRLPQEQFSEVPFYWVNIVVPWPGAGAQDVERSVTAPIEQEMRNLEKLKQIQSTSSEGLSLVRVQFDDGIDDAEFVRLFQDARTLFSRVQLPEGTLQASLEDFSSNDFLPVIEIVLSGNVDYSILYESAQALESRILSIPEVAAVNMVGLREKQIAIFADRDRLDPRGIGLVEISRALQAHNVSVPAGILETENREYPVRVAAEIDSLEALGRLVVRRQDRDGATVRIQDVAELKEVYNPLGEYTRFNGEPAISLGVTKVARGDAVGIVQGVRAQLAEYEDLLPQGVSVELINDSTIQIRDSISVLLNNALQGLILLTAILFVFLGLRNALITAVGIPITFAVTFFILEITGETLNSNTLFGLVLVLGMIVDHAIVITENAFRLRSSGIDRITAAIDGTNQVAMPIVSSALTTIAAFLPLTLLPGTIGKFLRVIPLTVIIALAVSTVESILFIPSHLAEWPGDKRISKRMNLFDRIATPLERFFSAVYRFRKLGLLCFVLLLIGVFSSVPFLRQDLFSAEDFSLFYIDVSMPAGTNRTRSLETIQEFEKRLLPLRGNGELVNVLASVGSVSGSDIQILVDLTERKEGRVRPVDAVMEEARWLCMDIAGPDTVLFRKVQSGPPVSAPIGFRLRSDSNEDLAEVITLLEQRLATYPEVFNIKSSVDAGNPQLNLQIYEDRAASMGLSIASIGAFVRGTLDGFPAGSLFLRNEEIDIVVRYKERGAASPLDNLAQLKLPTPDGRLISFSTVAELREQEATAAIRRIDGRRELSIEAQTRDKRMVRALNADIDAWFKAELRQRYPDMALITGGEFAELADLLLQILRVFLLGIFLIYAILGAQFKSYSQPFLILLSVPMAFGGVVVYLLLSGTAFSTTVLYATVALAGIAVNDAIVLIDFINERRKEGATVAVAVVAAAKVRFRPVVLTSVTTIAGLLPTALGFGGYSVVWSPMAGTIIAGLVFSTVTTLTVIPMLYGLLYDRNGRKSKGTAHRLVPQKQKELS